MTINQPETTFVEVWSKRFSMPLNDWVEQVSQTFAEERKGILLASKLVGAEPAELQAVLNLATLDSDDLARIAEFNPPMTTWFQLARGNSEEIEEALKALENVLPGQSRKEVVEQAYVRITGPTVETKVASLPYEVFEFVFKKGSKGGYGIFTDSQERAMKSFARSRKTGRPLTPAQIKYAADLFVKLVDEGAIKEDSPDDDQEYCDQVLMAVGRMTK